MATRARPARTRRAAHRLIEAPQKPAHGASAIREALGVTRKVFSRLTGYSERAIAKWESGEAPGEASRQRLRELERLRDALGTVMRPDFIGSWLQTPNRQFDGLKPLEVMERGEVDRIWRMIYLLESGTPS